LWWFCSVDRIGLLDQKLTECIFDNFDNNDWEIKTTRIQALAWGHMLGRKFLLGAATEIEMSDQ
jgi:hypothetical protein